MSATDTFVAALKIWIAIRSPTSNQNTTFRNAANIWLATLSPPAPVPVVSSASLSVSAGYGLDSLVGSISATNAPTAFQIIGDPNGYFAIYPSGNLRMSTLNLPPPGLYNIKISASNAAGIGIPAPVAITLQAAANPPPPPSPPPPLTGYPDATNTGVLAGVVLTPHAGDLSISTVGQVVNGLDISGRVTISANNAVMQNCRVTVAGFVQVQITAGTGVTIQNCEINGVGTGNDGSNGIWRTGGGPAKYIGNNIHHVENGIVPGSGDLIQDNYIHDMAASGSPHYDPIQIDGGLSNIDIEHNTCINLNGWTSGGVMIDNYFGPISNIKVNNNRMIGGGFTVYDDGHFNSNPITGVSFTNNRLGTGVWGYSDFNGTNPTWTGNMDDVTGKPI